MSRAEPRGEELIRRYKDNYSIADDAPVTEAMILAHWELEKSLTRELLASTPENRREVFERCYSRLYAECAWLNQFVGTRPPTADARAADPHVFWLREIGPPPKQVYEIGSGRGELITRLAADGHECTATEITSERGEKFTSSGPNLRWELTDGVHLDRYAGCRNYDVVISDQVVEHLHPDDVAEHFAAAFRLLRPGGLYLLGTPHRHFGPCDVSRVFGTPRPMGMHLREYTFGDLIRQMRVAGFGLMRIPSGPGWRSDLLFRILSPTLHNAGYYAAHRVFESLVDLLPFQTLRRRAWCLGGKVFGLRVNILLAAQKRPG